MIYINTILYYTFFSSAVIFYGIGLSRLGESGIVKFPPVLFFVKMIITVFASAALSWVISNKLLLKLNILEMYPIIIFLILIVLNTFLECFVRLVSNKTTTEFLISYMIVFLAVTESVTFSQCMVICLSIFCSIGIIYPFLITFKCRICNNGLKLDGKYYSVIFVFLGIIALILSVCDVSWLNAGVFD